MSEADIDAAKPPDAAARPPFRTRLGAWHRDVSALASRGAESDEREDVPDGSDPRARPVAHLRPRRLLARTMDEDRAHSRPLRARELVVRAVSDEDRLNGFHAESLARELVDPGIRLAQAARAGEDLRIEEARERRLGPHVDRVLAAHGDQAGTKAPRTELPQRLDDAFSRPAEHLPRERAPPLEEFVHRVLPDP